LEAFVAGDIAEETVQIAQCYVCIGSDSLGLHRSGPQHLKTNKTALPSCLNLLRHNVNRQAINRKASNQEQFGHYLQEVIYHWRWPNPISVIISRGAVLQGSSHILTGMGHCWTPIHRSARFFYEGATGYLDPWYENVDPAKNL